MKAEFKRTKTADGLPLSIGKMYDVLDVRAGRKTWELKEIKVKNDLGQERWYKASKFKLFAEVAAYMKEPTEAYAGQSAARSATPDGSQVFVGIDVAKGADMTAVFRAREGLEIGKAIAAGIADGFGLHYGA